MKKQSGLPKAIAKKLPRKFGGADVARGHGVGRKAFEELENKALDQFNATRETFLVIADRALEDRGGSEEVWCFTRKSVALRFARALANGNVDQRVLRICGQTLVVATDNDL